MVNTGMMKNNHTERTCYVGFGYRKEKAGFFDRKNKDCAEGKAITAKDRQEKNWKIYRYRKALFSGRN